MDEESMRNLRLDRRLSQRRGWIGAEELERELQGLSDVSDKIQPAEEETESKPGSVSEADSARDGAAPSEFPDGPQAAVKVGGTETGEA